MAWCVQSLHFDVANGEFFVMCWRLRDFRTVFSPNNGERVRLKLELWSTLGIAARAGDYLPSRHYHLHGHGDCVLVSVTVGRAQHRGELTGEC